jgi:hypothetical protein
MATDKSEPKIGLIFSVGLLCIVTLFVVHAALTSYFNFALQGEELRKFGEVKPTALLALRAAEKERLSGGAMPIDKAMDQLAHMGRRNASPEIVPGPSKDLAPLAGWSKMPAEVPTAMMLAEVDAGAPLATEPGQGVDGGAKSDAGAPKKKP